MKRVKSRSSLLLLVIILFLAVTATFGISGQNGDNKITYLKGLSDIRWGIDIRGGVEATFTPETEEKSNGGTN